MLYGTDGFLQRPGQAALHELGVVEIELDTEVGMADAGDGLAGLGGQRRQVPRPLEGIDGFDQHADIGVPAGFGGPFQVFDVHLVAALAAFAIGHDAGKHMDEPALKGLSVFQRLADAVAEFGLAAGQVRDAVFARLHVAGGGR